MRWIVLLLASAFVIGCGPSRAPFVRPTRTLPASPVPPARAEFARGDGERVLRAAQAVLRASGHRIAHRSEVRIATAERERDVPCSSGSCLARESIEVRVGHYVARVEITRAVWNTATRSWDPALGTLEALDALALEQAILRRILEATPTPGSGELAVGPAAARH